MKLGLAKLSEQEELRVVTSSEVPTAAGALLVTADCRVVSELCASPNDVGFKAYNIFTILSNDIGNINSYRGSCPETFQAPLGAAPPPPPPLIRGKMSTFKLVKGGYRLNSKDEEELGASDGYMPMQYFVPNFDESEDDDRKPVGKFAKVHGYYEVRRQIRLSLGEGVHKSELISSGWSAAEAAALVAYSNEVMELKFESVPKQCKGEGMERRSMSFSVGEAVACWRVPTSSEYAEKPKHFERESFRRWVRYSAWIKTGELKEKNQYVTGNLACQSLYYVSTRLHPKVLAAMLEKAHVFIDFYVSGKAVSKFLRTPKPMMYSSLLDVKGSTLNPSAKVFVPKPLDTETVVVRYQGGMISAPKAEITVSPITHSIVFPQLANIWGAGSDKKGPDSIPEIIVAYTSLVVGVFAAKNIESVLCLLGLYFTGVGKAHFSVFKERVELLKTLPILQGGFFDNIKEAVSSIIFETGVYALLESIGGSVKGVILPLVQEMSATIAGSVKKESAQNAAKWIVDKVIDFTMRIKECFMDRSFDPLWSNKWDVGVWLQESSDLRLYFTTLVSESPTPANLVDIKRLQSEGFLSQRWLKTLTKREWMTIVSGHLVKGNAMLSRFSHVQTVVTAIKLSQGQLAGFAALIASQISSVSTRPAPFAIFIHGPPGVGKTNMVKALVEAFCARNGCDEGRAGVYYWQPGANFQDGLTSQPVIIFDDADTKVMAPGKPDHYDEVLALQNSKPYSVEQANVELKGKVFAQPKLLLFCTMNKMGNCQNKPDAPAFFRRFHLYLEVSVKDKYRVKGSKLMDPKLAEGNIDLYNLGVSHFVDNVQKEYRSKAVPRSFPGLLATMWETYDDFAAREGRRMGTAYTGPRCKVCFLPSNQNCGHPQREYEYGEEKSDDPNFVFEENDEKEVATLEQDLVHQGRLCPCAGSSSSSISLLGDLRKLSREEKWTLYSVMSKALTTTTSWQSFDHDKLTADFEKLAADLEHDEAEAYESFRHVFNKTYLISDLVEAKAFAYVRMDSRRRTLECQGLDWVSDPEYKDLAWDFEVLMERDSQPLHVNFLAVKESARMLHKSVTTRFLAGIRNQKEKLVLEAKEADSKLFDPSLIGAVIVPVLAVFLYLRRTIVSQVETLQAREPESPEKGPREWIRADCEVVPVFSRFNNATFTKEDLVVAIKANTVQVYGQSGYEMFALCVTPHIFAVPTHIFVGGPSIKVKVGAFMHTYVKTLETCALSQLNGEICYFKLPGTGLSGCVGKLWPDLDATVHSFDGYEVWNTQLIGAGSVNQWATTSDGKKIFTTDAKTQDGHCGSTYTGSHSGRWKGVAMHYGIKQITKTLTGETTCLTQAGPITRMEVERIAAYFRLKPVEHAIVKQCFAPSQRIKDLAIGSFGKYSEVAAAKTFVNDRIKTIGYLDPPLTGSTMKSKVTRSILSPYYIREETEACGQYPGFFIPVFVGHMEDGIWKSPWTNAFSTMNFKIPNDAARRLAIADYLNGIQDLFTEGYRPLTENEVYKGQQGTTLHAKNIRTSVGPPFNKAKRHFMDLSEERASVCPELLKISDEVEDMLNQGLTPIFLSINTLKDEPTKPGKMPRIFNVLPDVFNCMLKKYAGPFRKFMRANPFFFESMIGINMTSVEGVNELVNRLRAMDPTLSRMVDGDVTAMDKSWSDSQLADFGFVCAYISWVIGSDAKKVWLLCNAIAHLIYSIKNDCYQTPNNPSGHDSTGEQNGVEISLGERYVYYRDRILRGEFIPIEEVDKWFHDIQFGWRLLPPVPQLDFRSKIALVTFGDDNAKAYASGVEIPDNYAELWRDELGMVMKPADKGASKFSFKKITEITFLKRHFVPSNVLGGAFVAPLEMKSIIRMLTMKKGSSLTDRDHGAVVLTQAAREMVYHGIDDPQVFEAFVQKALLVAGELGLLENPYLSIKPLEEYVAMCKEGTFQTWTLEEVIQHVDVERLVGDLEKVDKVSFRYQAGKIPVNFSFTREMSSLNLVKASVDEAAPVSLHSETTVIQSINPTEKVGYAGGLPPAVQPTDLAQFMARPVYLFTHTLSYLDTVGGVISYATIVSTLNANAALENKLRNYSLMRGTLEITAQVSTPGNTYGAYVVTGFPMGKSLATSVNTSMQWQNCMQNDFSYMIDCASPQDFRMELPFVCDEDYMPCPDPGAYGAMWTLNVTCLAPITTAITGGVSVGKISFYANWGPDLELVVPAYQGKKAHAIKGHGPVSSFLTTAGEVAEKLSGVPVIGGVASMVSELSHPLASIASFFGFTREVKEVAPMRVTGRAISNIARMDAGDTSDVSALTVACATSIDPALAGDVAGEDEMALSVFEKRPVVVKTALWEQSQIRGDIVATIWVSPFYSYSSDPYIPTSGGYFGLPFEWWRSDMEYELVMPASCLHQGSLQIVYMPNDVVIVGDPTNIAFNIIAVVGDNARIRFSVGYAREVPYLQSRLITDDMAIIPYGTCNGRIEFIVSNPLVCQNSAAPLHLTVFACTKNLDVFQPRDTLTFIDEEGLPVDYTLSSDLIYQGKESDMPQTVTQVLFPGGIKYPGLDMCSGERIGSLRAMAQKFSPLIYQQTEMFYANMQTPPNAGSLTQTWTWAHHAVQPFLGMAGSERYKTIARGNTNGSPTVFGVSKFLRFSGSPLPIMSSLTPTREFGFEGQVPFYTPRRFVYCREVRGSTAGNTVTHLNAIPMTGASPGPFKPFHSFGSDLRVNHFRQTPAIVFRVNPQPQWLT